ncbi:MAG: glycosyltransferase family 4 protein [Bacteroidota bacterium]|nr:glycosyltransferase family 4 protein [Bacteroidota bacterium]
MRISIFANEIPATVFIEDLITALASRGHEVFIYGKYIKNPHYDNYPNIHIVHKPKTQIKKILYALKYFFKLIFTKPKLLIHIIKISKVNSFIRWMQKFNMYITLYDWNLDIIHIQWAKSVTILDELIKDGKIKTVLSLRGTHINVSPIVNEKIKNEFEKLFPFINGFHGVSYAIISESQKYYHNLPNRSIVAYPSISKETYNLFNISQPSAINFNIISVGRFHHIKGFMYALDALKILIDEGIPVYYTLVAFGTLPEQLLFQIEDLDLHNHIRIIPSLPHDEVLAAIQNADVLLLSSIDEGIPNVIIEAMAVGTPVVSTDCSGIVEVIENGVNGIITKVCTPSSIAQGLTKVYNLTPSEREQMILKAREQLNVNHLQEMQLNNIEKLYDSVLNNWKETI